MKAIFKLSFRLGAVHSLNLLLQSRQHDSVNKTSPVLLRTDLTRAHIFFELLGTVNNLRSVGVRSTSYSSIRIALLRASRH